MPDTGQIVGFFKRDGKAIPIRRSDTAHERVNTFHQAFNRKVAAVKAGARTALDKTQDGLHHVGLGPSPVKVNKKLDALGIGLSVASGVVGAATFAGGAAGFAGGLLASHGIDALGAAANIASVSGPGHRKDRIKQAGRQELRNFAIGNAIYGAGVLGIKKNRVQAGKMAQRTVIAIAKAARFLRG